MALFIFIGVLSLVTGLLFLIAPKKLREINDKCSTVVTNLEDKAFTYRAGVGLSLIIASVLFFFVAWYINLKT